VGLVFVTVKVAARAEQQRAKQVARSLMAGGMIGFFIMIEESVGG
jgi:hypothetical protein